MKAKDIIQLLELGKTFKTKTKRVSRKKDDISYSDIDISMLLHKKLEEAHVLEKLLKDHEKAHKEEKREEKKGWSMAHVSYFLIATFPITAPLYVMYLKAILT